MAIRSFATAITGTEYTKVGSNTTVFSATEELVGKLRVVITDVGDATPAAGEANFVPFDNLFRYEGAACDIWMISTKGPTTVYGVAE